jgi:hypothetical protein
VIPNIIIRPQTAQEEYNYLLFLIRDCLFLHSKNYSVTLPNHPAIIRLEKNPSLLKSENLQELGHLFLNEIYEPDFYKKGVANLKPSISVFRHCISLLKPLNSAWNFKLYTKYSIFLTRYGPGGGYWTKPDGTAIISLLTTKSGAFKLHSPIHTIVHEIVHLGIEDVPVKPNKLNHEEKETVTDQICKIVFKDILKDYYVPDFGQDKLQSYVTKDTILSLPAAIKEYAKKFKIALR